MAKSPTVLAKKDEWIATDEEQYLSLIGSVAKHDSLETTHLISTQAMQYIKKSRKRFYFLIEIVRHLRP